MRNACRVFWRDGKRLAHVRKAWIILIGVIIIPSLYAWLNIVAFWDPYSNTETINVAIVNQDEGATSEASGDIDVGSQLVDQLGENDQLGWQFLDEEAAMDAVRSGSSYASIIIPPDFSRDFVSITSGDFTRPTLMYYVNEKANAIAPKITDVGASTLDTQVNSTFVSVVTQAVTEELKDVGADTEARLRDAQNNTVGVLDEAVGKVASARERVNESRVDLSDAQNSVDLAIDTLATVDTTLGDVEIAVAQAQDIAGEVQQEVATFTDSITRAYVSGATLLADATSELNGSISKVTSGIERGNTVVGPAIDDVDQVIMRSGETLDELQALLDDADPESELAGRLSEVITASQDRREDDRNILSQLQQLNTDITDATAAIQNSADSFTAATDEAALASQSVRDIVLQTGPDIDAAMSRLSASAGAFSSAIQSQRVQLRQAQGVLASLGDQLGKTSSTLSAIDDNLAATQSELGGVRTDVIALSTADAWDSLATVAGLDAEEIAQFMASPVEVDEHAVFPVATYGSAMAPLFSNLSLWIGAFVLVVIFKLEVDTEGVAGLTVRQAYFGRWMLLAAISVLQAVVLTTGNLVIGVETVSGFALMATGVLIGLTYLSIIYALSVAFGYVGKGMCILLVIMQIPGASGLYPIEMMPGFFRSLYPLFPFSYGIDAMRETISGFYGDHYWRFMLALAVFVALSFILGLFLRQRLGNFTLLFNSRIADTELLVSEDVHITERRYRLPQIIAALTNRAEFRNDVTQRARRFTQRYPMLLRATLIVALVVILALGFIAVLVPVDKATLLGFGVLFSLLIIGFVVTLEYIEQSIDFATDVADMSDSELRHTLMIEGSSEKPVASMPPEDAAVHEPDVAGADDISGDNNPTDDDPTDDDLGNDNPADDGEEGDRE